MRVLRYGILKLRVLQGTVAFESGVRSQESVLTLALRRATVGTSRVIVTPCANRGTPYGSGILSLLGMPYLFKRVHFLGGEVWHTSP